MTTVRLGDDELEAGRWFTRAPIDAALEAGEPRPPPRTSMSRHLIESWPRAG